MNNALSVQSALPKTLPQHQYFEHLLQAACEAEILSSADLSRIQLELLHLLAERVDCYTLGESSSIPVRAAKELLQGCTYTIGAALKQSPDTETAAYRLRDEPVNELYQKGRRRLDTLLKMSRQLWSKAAKTRLRLPHAAYNATMDGIGSFFAHYNPDFAAHETPADIDYPLCRDTMDRTGVEYMREYLYGLTLENQFCLQYNQLTIHRMMLCYDRYYSHLLVNLFERVWTNGIGCMLAGQSPFLLLLDAHARRRLEKQLTGRSRSQLLSLLGGAQDRLFERMEIPGNALRSHAAGLPEVLAVQLETALAGGNLDAVFVGR